MTVESGMTVHGGVEADVARRVEELRDEVDILEYRAGRVEALGRLISRWQPRMYSYVLAMLGERDAAWDVSQELWLGVIAALARRAPIDHFPSWIYAAARNKCVSHLRKRNRLVETEAAGFDDVDGRAETSDAIALKAEDAQLVRACLKDLSLPLREAVVLFHMEGLALDEVAAILGMPRGTVQSRLHAGRQALRKMLARKGLGHDGR